MAVNIEQGRWITVEGPDGGGKTTVVPKIIDYLNACGIPSIGTREPGGNPLSEKLRPLIFNPELRDDPLTQLALFTAARRRNILETVLPAWKNDQVVVSDRSEGSTYAYQHFQYGLPLSIVQMINEAMTEGIKPTLTILLDVDPGVGIKRVIEAKGGESNHFDQSKYDEWNKRREGYLQLAENYQRYGLNPWVIIDANGSQEKVFRAIVAELFKQGLGGVNG